MFEVLGSVVFWVFFILLTLIAGSSCLKKLSPPIYKTMRTGKLTNGNDWGQVFIVLLFCFSFWPFISIFYVLIFILFPFIGKIIFWAGSIIPEFEIKKK
jgi:hypothetical protein